MQKEALLLPLDLHGFVYLNAVLEVARHRWRPHEDPVASHSCTLLAYVLSSTRLDIARHSTFCQDTVQDTCCGSIFAAPLLTGFGGQQWGQVLVRTS